MKKGCKPNAHSPLVFVANYTVFSGIAELYSVACAVAYRVVYHVVCGATMWVFDCVEQ
jgi:hypothetical protein